MFRSLLLIALLSVCMLTGSVTSQTIGIDGSLPPSVNTWRLARTYFPLVVQDGVDVVFTALGSHGLVMTSDVNQYNNCTGVGKVLIPADTRRGSYTFKTEDYGAGTYYFYNNNMDGLMCRAGMKAQVEVVEQGTLACSTAKTNQKLCKTLAQCTWKKLPKNRYQCQAKKAKSG